MIDALLDLEGRSLKGKFLAEMANAKAWVMFYSKAAAIVRNRQPKGTGMEDWDPNEVCTIKEFNKNVEVGVNVYCTLKRIYVTEFDDIENAEEAVEIAAEALSEVMLDEYGWKKEEAKCC